MKGWRSKLTLLRREAEFALHAEGLLSRIHGAALPGGASWARTSASVVVFLLFVVMATGVGLSLGYAPSTASAHASVGFLTEDFSGSLIRNLHFHGTSYLMVALIVQALRVALTRAHRAPRQMLWVTGVVSGLLILGLALTGALLPWDQSAYYGTQVRLGIAEGVPLVGPTVASLLRGGDVLGNLTLTRFHGLHVVVLPLLLGGLLGFHLFMRIKLGLSSAAGVGAPTKGAEKYWPHQVTRNVFVVSVVGLALWLQALLVPAPFGDIADPSRPFQAEPAWYDYWLYELVHGAEPIQWLGSVVAPGLIVTFVLLFPWLDRKGTRLRQRRGLIALLALFGFVVCLTVSCALGLKADRAARLAAGVTETEAPPPLPAASVSADTLRAAMLYGQFCSECHGPRGEPIDEDATDMRTADFAQMAQADFGHLVDAVLNGGEMMEAQGDKVSEEEARLILREVVLRFREMAAEEGD